MKTFRRISIILLFSLSINFIINAQEYNPVYAAIPSLQIGSDARAGAMGDVGVATQPDVYSQHWNPAKYAAMDETGGVAFSYTPWLRQLVKDIDMVYLSGYWRFGKNKLNALSGSLRYFSLGETMVPDLNTHFWETVSPNEFAFDLSYSRKLNEKFFTAVTMRYIHADYSGGNDYSTPGNAFAMDFSGYFTTPIAIAKRPLTFAAGIHLSNIGSKISYDGGNTKMFLPANLRLGTSLRYSTNSKHLVSLSFDINKLLVPTPLLPTSADDKETPEEKQKRIDDYFSTSSIAGIFKSFGDAPGGFKEELQEIMWSLGAEYVYNKQFALRTGYFHENKYKGNRQYLSLGGGFNVNAFRLDVAYLIATSPSNPLGQTLRFSLGVSVDRIREWFHK